MVIRLLGAVLLLACPAAAQVPSPAAEVSQSPALRSELEQLGVVAEALDRSLPSLTCQETAVSEIIDRGKVKKHVEFSATLRAVRTPGSALKESLSVTTLNGKPHSGANPGFPYFTNGGFDSAMVFFLPERQACYRFSLSPGRIDFETAADVEAHRQCRPDGVQGFALLDGEGNVIHMERHVSAQATNDFHLVPFAAIDFAPVTLNGQVFRLSQHLVSEGSIGRATGRFEATYSDCKLFTVSVKIGPATEVSPGDNGSEASPAASHP
jgi:hypothetical protein